VELPAADGVLETGSGTGGRQLRGPAGSLIMKYAADNIIPSTVELGGKSPNIFFSDVMDQEDAFVSKAVEGAVLAFC
jgi:acyl-CoA reductase-like NAD-dependent aldehyde dehydrogenase